VSTTRRPVTYCDIHQKTCSLTYGSAPCTAAVGTTGATKCFNTRATCQDLDNFAETTKTLRLVEPVQSVPFDWDAIPSLRRVSIKPAKLSYAGLLRGTSPLGVRGAVTIEVQDHTDGDSLTDPYLADRAYDPVTRGTFWGKWLARHQDWTDLQVDVVTAELDDDVLYDVDSGSISTDGWGRGLESVDGTITIAGGKLTYTKGAGDGTRPRIVKRFAVIPGVKYRITTSDLTGTSPRHEFWISTGENGEYFDAVTDYAVDDPTDEVFTSPLAYIYLTMRCGTGSTTGDTTQLEEIKLERVTSKTRTYFLEEVAGPDARGNVSLTCRDVLSRVGDKKVQVPRATEGTLDGALTSGATTVTIEVPGIDPDLTQYAQVTVPDTDGLLQIGDEIMRYSGRSDDSPTAGKIQFFSVTRGVYGTTAEAHDDGDKVQWGREWINSQPWEVVADILEYWGNVPSSWIDRTAWEAEHDRWMTPYDQISGALIDPTDVEEAVADVLASCPAYIWTDVEGQQVRFRAVRSPDEEIVRLDDTGAFLAGTPSRKVEIDEQVSRVEVFHNVVTYGEDLDEIANFREARVLLGDQFGQPRPRRVFSRWLKTDTQALQTARTVLLASNVLPVYITAEVGIRYVDQIGPGSIVRVDTRNLQDATGARAPALFLVVSAGENNDGTRLKLTMRTIGGFSGVSNYASDSIPDYATATADQKDENGFYADDDGRLAGSASPYKYA